MKKILIILLLAGCILPISCKAVRMQALKNKMKHVDPNKMDADTFKDNKVFQESSALFDDTKLHIIKITIDKYVYQSIARGAYFINKDKVYGYASSLEFDGKIIEHVGMRRRGNVPTYKTQYKISFDSRKLYTNRSKNGFRDMKQNKKRKFFGVSKINLRASQNDPSIMREKLASDVFQMAGAIASRVGFARLYVNEEYQGIYLVTEQIDSKLLKSRFKNGKGYLYKGLSPATFIPSSKGSYQLKTHTKKGDKGRMVEFFKALKMANTPAEIAALVNVDNILSYHAGAVISGHWDSFVYNPNNDYLYLHNDGRWRIIAWDLDNTFGSGVGWGFPVLNTSIYKMYDNPNYKQLFDKIMRYPAWRKLYEDKVHTLISGGCSYASMLARVERYKALIKDAVKEDPDVHIDWGRGLTQEDSYQMWEESFTTIPSSWGHRGFGDNYDGLLGWIKDRTAIIEGQLKSGYQE